MQIVRKLSLATQFGAASVAMGLLMICASRNVLLVFIFIARAMMASVYQVVYIYTAEIFPTNVRSVGLGFCSMFARFASILVPFVAEVLIKHSFYAVVVVFSAPLLISAITSLTLKTETNQRALEDTAAVALSPLAKDYQEFE